MWWLRYAKIFISCHLMAEHVPSMCEALDLIPSMEKKISPFLDLDTFSIRQQ
jgi:hypothetical protein